MLWAHQNCRQEAAARLDSGGQTACTGPYAMHPAGECCVSWWATQLPLQGAAESMGMPSMHQTGGLLRAKVGREVAAGSCRYMAALNACGQVGAGK